MNHNELSFINLYWVFAPRLKIVKYEYYQFFLVEWWNIGVME
jgi:hypothetical protein